MSIARTSHLPFNIRSLTITDDYLSTEILHARSMVAVIYQSLLSPRGSSRGNYWIFNVAAQEIAISNFAEPNVPEQLRTLGWSSERVLEARTRQKDLPIEQDELMKSSLHFDHLAETLGSLPNLTCMRFSSGGVDRSRKRTVSSGQVVFLSGPSTMTDGRHLITFFRADSHISACPVT